MAWVRARLSKLQKGALDSGASDTAYQLLAHCRWLSPASSTTKTGRHDIAEILLKVALKHQKSINQSINRIIKRGGDPLNRFDPAKLLKS
jgi:hypothetical protein